MASGVAGFIDYDEAGKPFMGLLVEDGNVMVKLFLARKGQAFEVAGELGRQLNAMAKDLQTTKDQLKIQAVNGVLNNGTLRKS